jgi:outer membrane protein TolC
MRRYLLIFILLAGSTSLNAQDTLTQDRVRSLAMENNLNLRSLSLNVEFARAEYYRVNNFFPSFPKIDIDYETDKFTSDHGSYLLEMSLTQEIEIGGQFSTRKELADIRLQKARLNYNRSLFEFENELNGALAEVNTASLKLQLIREIININESLLNYSRQRLNAGDISQLDFNLIQIENNNYIVELKAQELELRNSINSLNIYLGDNNSKIAYIIPDTNVHPLAVSLEQIRNSAALNRSDLRLIDYDIKEADAEISLAKGENIPNLELKVGYNRGRSIILGDDIIGSHNISRIDDKEGSMTFGLGFSLPLPFSGLYNFRQGDIQIAEIQKQIALNERRLRERILDVEITNAFYAYQNSLNALQLLQNNNSIIVSTIELLRRGYEKGEISIINFLSELSRLYTFRQNYIEAIEEYKLSVVELERVTQTKLK